MFKENEGLFPYFVTLFRYLFSVLYSHSLDSLNSCVLSYSLYILFYFIYYLNKYRNYRNVGNIFSNSIVLKKVNAGVKQELWEYMQ